jgi:hypothetical protein
MASAACSNRGGTEIAGNAYGACSSGVCRQARQQRFLNKCRGIHSRSFTTNEQASDALAAFNGR